MNPLILNRDFQHPADGWYQIEPKGDHPNRASSVVQVIDDDAASSIVNRFNAEAANPNFAGMLIDHEHFKHDTSKETIAYGWLTKLENRTDGIYGQVRWTATGKAAVDGGDYRFFSTEYDPSDLKILNGGAARAASGGSSPREELHQPRRVRPLRLDGLTLTNDPNNKGQKPITNRSGANGPSGTDFPGSRESADAKTQQQPKANKMKSVCTLLGLSAEADESSVHAAVATLKNRITTLEPLEATNTTLKNRNTELEAEQCDTLLDAYQVKDAKMRETLKPMLSTLKNRADRVTALTNLGHKLPDARKPAGTKVLNRGQAEQTPTGDKAEAVSVTPQQLDAEVRKLMNRDGIKDFTVGFNALMGERPELFAKAE